MSTDGGSDPLWSKDGRELFYRAADALMTVPVTLQQAFSAGRPRRIFAIPSAAHDNSANYDVSPDGSWFVVSGGSPNASTELHVVLNWIAEVESRASSRQADGSAAPSLKAELWTRTK